MTDAELRSLERLCAKAGLSHGLSDGNVATLTTLGITAASEVRSLRVQLATARGALAEACDIASRADMDSTYERIAELRRIGGIDE